MSGCDEDVFAHETLLSGSIECYISGFIVQVFQRYFWHYLGFQLGASQIAELQ